MPHSLVSVKWKGQPLFHMNLLNQLQTKPSTCLVWEEINISNLVCFPLSLPLLSSVPSVCLFLGTVSFHFSSFPYPSPPSKKQIHTYINKQTKLNSLLMPGSLFCLHFFLCDYKETLIFVLLCHVWEVKHMSVGIPGNFLPEDIAWPWNCLQTPKVSISFNKQVFFIFFIGYETATKRSCFSVGVLWRQWRWCGGGVCVCVRVYAHVCTHTCVCSHLPFFLMQ